MKNYSQTIIIPTRNRAETAIHAIESCLLCQYENKQIVVVDNSDDDSLRNMLSEAGWLDRVNYHKNTEVLSMRDNWERGLELADGELVSVIGDDDAILGSSMEVANFAFNRVDIDVLNGSSAIYKWPNYPFQGRRNYLSFEFGEEIKIIRDPRSMLRAAYQYDVLMGTGPGLYYGFVKKDFLNSLKKRRGKYLIDKIPDFDSGYCTLLYAGAYALSKRPLFIQGHSGKSNSGSMRFAASQKKNIEIFVSESDESTAGLFSGALSDIRSNNAVIVSAQLRFKSEIEQVLGNDVAVLDKSKAWKYILKGLSEGYDVVEFISSIPALRRLSEEWGVRYSLSDKFEPFVGDSSLEHEQGFIKNKIVSSEAGPTVESNGYGSVVVNGAMLDFKNILDAVRHIDSMLPTMRASADEVVAARARSRVHSAMILIRERVSNCIELGDFEGAKSLIDEILRHGEIGIDLDDQVLMVADHTEEFDWGSRYFARRFSATGGTVELQRLNTMYEKMGLNDLSAALQAGLSQLNDGKLA